MSLSNLLSRRRFIRQLLAAGLGFTMPPLQAKDRNLPAQKIISKTIPASGEAIPVMGMGSWLTFDVGDDMDARSRRLQVLQTFFDRGGAMIDSSPMYGSSQEVIGYCLARIKNKQNLFAATKVWIMGQLMGKMQMRSAEKLWGVKHFDLMQIHNMLDWETHLETLQEWKAQGRIRYIGITTSHGRRHRDLEKALLGNKFDFVQLTYNMLNREAEKRLLPLARERGIAVIANRPFGRGELFDYVSGKPLPDWAGEIGCHNWAQFFLKYIVSHPAVTCAIPATTRVDHMEQNMDAAHGRLPDQDLRQRMQRYIADI